MDTFILINDEGTVVAVFKSEKNAVNYVKKFYTDLHQKEVYQWFIDRKVRGINMSGFDIYGDKCDFIIFRSQDLVQDP